MTLKTVTIAVLALSVAAISCRRDYTCTCTKYSRKPSHGDGIREEKLGRIPSDDATETCRKIQINREYDTCVLTSVK